jgi:hypothetical protein
MTDAFVGGKEGLHLFGVCACKPPFDLRQGSRSVQVLFRVVRGALKGQSVFKSIALERDRDQLGALRG